MACRTSELLMLCLLLPTATSLTLRQGDCKDAKEGEACWIVVTAHLDAHPYSSWTFKDYQAATHAFHPEMCPWPCGVELDFEHMPSFVRDTIGNISRSFKAKALEEASPPQANDTEQPEEAPIAEEELVSKQTTCWDAVEGDECDAACNKFLAAYPTALQYKEYQAAIHSSHPEICPWPCGVSSPAWKYQDLAKKLFADEIAAQVVAAEIQVDSTGFEDHPDVKLMKYLLEKAKAGNDVNKTKDLSASLQDLVSQLREQEASIAAHPTVMDALRALTEAKKKKEAPHLLKNLSDKLERVAHVVKTMVEAEDENKQVMEIQEAIDEANLKGDETELKNLRGKLSEAKRAARREIGDTVDF